MKYAVAALTLLVFVAAPFVLAQDEGSEEPTLFVAEGAEAQASNEVSIGKDGSFFIIAESLPQNQYTVNLSRPNTPDVDKTEHDLGEVSFESRDEGSGKISEEISVASSDIEVSTYSIDLNPAGEDEAETITKAYAVVIASPIEKVNGLPPRGLNEWVSQLEVSDVSHKQAAALAGVDRRSMYLRSDFNPIPEGADSATIAEVVRRTRNHVIEQDWVEDIDEHFDETPSDPEAFETSGFFVTTQGTLLTSNTPHRSPVSESTAQENENIDIEDDCYRNYPYRPPSYGLIGLPHIGSSIEAANTQPYECPGFVDSIEEVLPTQEEALDPETYCPNSMTEEKCIENVIRPTCESGEDGPGTACQAMLSDTVSGNEDFGRWRNYCNQNFNKGDVKLNATEIVSCMEGCYGTTGVGQNGNFRQPEPQNAAGGMNCGELVQNFCSNTKYASYVSKSNEDSPNTCEVSIG